MIAVSNDTRDAVIIGFCAAFVWIIIFLEFLPPMADGWH